MSASIQKLETEILKLAPSERAHLLECLIDSFEPDTTVGDTWIEEAQQRRDEVSSGAASLVPGDEAIARVRQHIG